MNSQHRARAARNDCTIELAGYYITCNASIKVRFCVMMSVGLQKKLVYVCAL